MVSVIAIYCHCHCYICIIAIEIANGIAIANAAVLTMAFVTAMGIGIALYDMIQHHKWWIPSIMVSHCAEEREGRKGGSILMLRHASATVSVTLFCNTNTRQIQHKYKTITKQIPCANDSAARQSKLCCSALILLSLVSLLLLNTHLSHPSLNVP